MAACMSIASRPSVRSVSFFSNFAKFVALDIDIPSKRARDSAVCCDCGAKISKHRQHCGGLAATHVAGGAHTKQQLRLDK